MSGTGRSWTVRPTTADYVAAHRTRRVRSLVGLWLAMSPPICLTPVALSLGESSAVVMGAFGAGLAASAGLGAALWFVPAREVARMSLPDEVEVRADEESIAVISQLGTHRALWGDAVEVSGTVLTGVGPDLPLSPSVATELTAYRTGFRGEQAGQYAFAVVLTPEERASLRVGLTPAQLVIGLVVAFVGVVIWLQPWMGWTESVRTMTGIAGLGSAAWLASRARPPARLVELSLGPTGGTRREGGQSRAFSWAGARLERWEFGWLLHTVHGRVELPARLGVHAAVDDIGAWIARARTSSRGSADSENPYAPPN